MKRNKRGMLPFITIKEFIGFFLGIIFINGLFWGFWYVNKFYSEGNERALAINILSAVIYCSLLGAFLWKSVQKFYYGRPMRVIAEVARKVAQGDFSVRIPAIHQEGKIDEIKILIDDFNLMVAELEQNEMMKKDFISNVSHEIKTPLAIIQSYATALQENLLNEQECVTYINSIVAATTRLSNLVTAILSLNKLENQNIFDPPKKYDLSEQLRCCLLAYEELWTKKEITIEIAIEEVMIYSDEKLLEIVWNNLITNAIKYTECGGKIKVMLWQNRNEIVFRIEDTGCGMSDNTIKHIYEKFYQGDTSHYTEGNGLGMALVKNALEHVNGSIEIESELGKGSIFTVKFSCI